MIYIVIFASKSKSKRQLKSKKLNTVTNLIKINVMVKRNRIIVPHGSVRKIAKSVHCSEPTVRYALRGALDTSVALLVRKRAIEMFGGVEAK